MSQMIYCSRETDTDAQQVKSKIGAILAVARRDNKRDDITGALLYASGFFAQVLEGPSEAVRRVFGKISNDPRHRDILVLAQSALPKRAFPQWTMGFMVLAEGGTEAVALLASAFLTPSEAIGTAIRDLLIKSEGDSLVLGNLWLC